MRRTGEKKLTINTIHMGSSIGNDDHIQEQGTLFYLCTSLLITLFILDQPGCLIEGRSNAFIVFLKELLHYETGMHLLIFRIVT
jgi:hypothetical protein